MSPKEIGKQLYKNSHSINPEEDLRNPRGTLQELQAVQSQPLQLQKQFWRK